MQYIIYPQDMIIFVIEHISSTDQNREAGFKKKPSCILSGQK